ncbi:MAG: hypothetical protein ACTSV2_18125 [Candidatus Thorarchaeota archaeon]
MLPVKSRSGQTLGHFRSSRTYVVTSLYSSAVDTMNNDPSKPSFDTSEVDLTRFYYQINPIYNYYWSVTE